MSSLFVQIPADIADTLATNAGILLTAFDPIAVGTASAVRGNILAATSGGVNVSCVATYSDFGEDVDNAPKNTKELKHLDSWECKMSGTAITVSTDIAKKLIGAASSAAVPPSSGDTPTGVTKITVNRDLASSDFGDLWYVCPYGTGEGFVAVKLINALNNGGFTMQSTKNGKGTFTFEFVGHPTITNPDNIPMEFYLKPSATASVQTVALGEST